MPGSDLTSQWVGGFDVLMAPALRSHPKPGSDLNPSEFSSHEVDSGVLADFRS